MTTGSVIILLSYLFMHPQYPAVPLDSLNPIHIVEMELPPLIKYELKQPQVSKIGLSFWQDRGGWFSFLSKDARFEGNIMRGRDFTPFDSAYTVLSLIFPKNGVDIASRLHYWNRDSRSSYLGHLHAGIFEMRQGGIFINFFIDFSTFKVADSLNSFTSSRISVSDQLIIPISKHTVNVFSTKFDYALHTATSVLSLDYTLRSLIGTELLIASGVEFNRNYELYHARPHVDIQYYGTRSLFLETSWGFNAGLAQPQFYDFLAPPTDTIGTIENYMYGKVKMEMKPTKNLSMNLSLDYKKGEGGLLRKGAELPHLYTSPFYRTFRSKISVKLNISNFLITGTADYGLIKDGIFYEPDYQGDVRLTWGFHHVKFTMQGRYTGPTPLDENVTRPPFYILTGYMELAFPYNLSLRIGSYNLTDEKPILYGDHSLSGRKYFVQMLWQKIAF